MTWEEIRSRLVADFDGQVIDDHTVCIVAHGAAIFVSRIVWGPRDTEFVEFALLVCNGEEIDPWHALQRNSEMVIGAFILREGAIFWRHVCLVEGLHPLEAQAALAIASGIAARAAASSGAAQVTEANPGLFWAVPS